MPTGHENQLEQNINGQCFLEIKGWASLLAMAGARATGMPMGKIIGPCAAA
jgi:hypothetical protein